MKTERPVIAVLLCLLLSPALLLAQRPLGDPFRVNLQTRGFQELPRLATNLEGEFVVAWSSSQVNGVDYTLHARRFAADSTPLTGEILVANLAPLVRPSFAVAMMADGSFVVVFTRTAPDSTWVLGARWYSPDGALEDDTVMSREPVSDFAVASRPDGGTVLAWAAGGPPSSIKARIFGPDHAPVGPSFLVGRLGGFPKVAVGPEGEFVIAWAGAVPEPSDPRRDRAFVAIRRFAADGSALGKPFAASAITEISPNDINVGKDGAGNFLVTWTGNFGTLGEGTFLRKFRADGAPLGRTLRQTERMSSLAVGQRGNFVLSWTRLGAPDPDLTDIFARRFAADGSPLGPIVQVSEGLRGFQGLPQVAIGVDGSFLVTWEVNQADGLSFDIYARRFRRR